MFTYLVSITTTTQQRKEAVTAPSQVTTGPMPGNQLVEGITHSRHMVDVTNGEMHFFLQRLEADYSAWFNGIQIVQVLEPTSILALATGFLFFHRRGT